MKVYSIGHFSNQLVEHDVRETTHMYVSLNGRRRLRKEEDAFADPYDAWKSYLAEQERELLHLDNRRSAVKKQIDIAVNAMRDIAGEHK